MRIKQKHLDRWARTRQKGRFHFIWVYYVFGWGVFTAITWSCLMGVLQGWRWNQVLLRSVIALIIFPICGYFLGMWLWRRSERRFAQAMPFTDSKTS